MASSRTGRYCGNRLFEWVMAIALTNTGLILLIWPTTLAAGNVRPLLHAIGPGELTALCLTIGLIRLTTLLLNGQLERYGPMIRATMAGISLLIWADMTAALWLQIGQPSVTTGIFVAVIVGELRSIARARRDSWLT
jgi:hypothetical protein